MRIAADKNHIFRLRPILEGYQNNTLRYSPPGDFPAHYASRIGLPRIMRSSITLDEVWDYRTNEYFWNYPIGVNRYEGDPNHAPYDWAFTRPAPSGVTFEEYLTTHSKACEEMIFFYRRYEREVISGVISMETYAQVLENVIEHYKALCPNIVYIEQNEPNCEVFGAMNAFEYYQFYRIMYQVVNRLNDRHHYDRPLRCVGPCLSFTAQQMEFYRQFLRLYKIDPCPQKRLDAYAAHEYHPDIDLLRKYYDAHIRILQQLELPEKPIFFDEFGMMHPTQKAEDNLVNASGVLESLFDSADMPGMHVFPWASFHNPVLQRSLTQFQLNDQGQYEATPHGMAMQLLHMMPEGQIRLTGDGGRRAFAAGDGKAVYLMITNYAACPLPVSLSLSGFDGDQVQIREYRCDQEHNNCFVHPGADRPLITGRQICKKEGDSFLFETILPPYSFTLLIAE